MQSRIAFLVGVALSQFFSSRPVQIDPLEIALLKNEIAHTRSTLEEYHVVQAQCKWNEWVQGLAIQALCVFDVVVLLYCLFKTCGKRQAALPEARPDTGGSSDSEVPESAPGCEKNNSLTLPRVRQLATVKTRPTRPSDLK